MSTDSSKDLTIDFGYTKNQKSASIDIRKQEEGVDSRTVASGSDVNFEIVVENTGDFDLTDVRVVDGPVPDCNRTIGNLAVGGIEHYTCTVSNVTETFTNIAKVVGTYNGTTVTDEDPSKVIVDDGPSDCNGVIGDFVWHDVNRNGIQDDGEPGIDDARVILTQGSSTIADTRTDSNGAYEFSGLCAGSYKVNVIESTVPTGFTPTIPNANNNRVVRK